MKPIIFILTILLFVHAALADESNKDNGGYENGSVPNFLELVGKALPGRCYLTSDFNKKIASVLMVSFDEEGFQVATLDAEKTRVDYFDKMSYEDVLKNHPVVKRMYLNVSETVDGAITEQERESVSYRGEMRETEKHIILRSFVNNKFIKYCNYIKPN